MKLVPMMEQIECVEREIQMRRRVYPRQVTLGKMSAANAKRQIEAMAAVLATLQAMPKNQMELL